MQLAILIAVVGVALHSTRVAAAESPPPLWLAAWCCMALVIGIGYWGCQRIVQALDREHHLAGGLHPSVHRQLAQLFQRLQAGLLVGWMLALVLIEWLGHWSQAIRSSALRDWWLIDDCLVFATIWLPWLMLWWAYAGVERAFLQACRVPAQLPDRGQYVALRARHYFGLCLLPVLWLFACYDVSGIDLHATGDTLSWRHVFPVIVLVMASPWLLRWITQGQPLPPGTIRSRLVGALHRWGVPVKELYVWKTSRQMLNAGVAGWLPGSRRVFLTDALLDSFSEDELEAVLAHEAAHIRRGHVTLRGAWLLLPLAVWWATQAWQPIQDTAPTWGAMHETIGLVLAALLWLVALPWISRQLEFDADAWAQQRLLERGLSGGLMADVLLRLDPATHRQRRWHLWLHPSTAHRVQVLADPYRGRQMMRRRAWLGWTVTLGWATALSLWVLGVALS